MKEVPLIFDFLSASINKSIDVLISKFPLSGKEWNHLLQQSIEHRVDGVVCDVIEKLPPQYAPPTDVLLQFYGNKIQIINDYEKKFRIARSFAHALSERGVKMVVLKGIAFGEYYDEPALRDLGDCDCYLGEKYCVGDEICLQLGGTVEHGTYKHSHLIIDNLLIENHRFFTDFNGTKKGILIESLLEKCLASNENIYIGDTKLICPNPQFNALFLLKHHLTDFLDEGIILRMIYDWAALLNKEQDVIDWDSLYRDIDSCGFRNFADVLTSIAVHFLGLKLTNDSITISYDDSLERDLIKDTLFRV